MAENNDFVTLRKSLDEVLDFSSEMIVLSLMDEKPERPRIDAVKQHCMNLKNRGIYNFDVDCDDRKFFQQIQKFASRVD